MGAIDEDEAIYKIMMAEHYISIIQDSPELINLIKTHINLGSSGQVPHTNAWGAVNPLLGIIGLQINLSYVYIFEYACILLTDYDFEYIF